MQDIAHVLGELRRFARFARPEVSEVDVAYEALRPLLAELTSPYKLVGGLAVIHHGYERFTVAIDLLVSPDARRELTERAPAHGFAVVTPRRLRHEPTGVLVDLLVEGQPIPRGGAGVTFPSPGSVGESPGDATFVGLRGLLELKLHSRRNKDVADVTELLKKVDDGRYLVLESEMPRELRSELARLRNDALEELEWARRDAEQDAKYDAEYEKKDDGT
ncbi:hypothetical protein LZC95_08520 [Pendulispora brunnea]|uniref:Uncharacterized protein n=1 Tax=Pendulispora brunnea TaxID=2905690 RepID=A0ABZ2KIV0_9BACT